MSELMSPKPCRACGGCFKITEPALKKGNYICKPCRKKESAKNLISRKERGLSVSGSKMTREYHRSYEKDYYQQDRVKKRRLDNFYERLKDPEERLKYDVRKETRNAIRRGDLIKQPCEVCQEKKVDAHHDDYSKPLSVRWLCRKHHAEHHAKARGETP